MLQKIIPKIVINLLCGVIALTAVPLDAQTETQVYVHRIETTSATEAGLGVNVYFSLYNSQDQAQFFLTDVDFDNLTLTVNGSTYREDQVDVAQGTLWISLLVDVSSGVTQDALRQLKEGLTNVLSGLPEDARVALVPFNRFLQQPLDMFRTVGELPDAIDRIQASSPGDANEDACIYDAVFDGLNSLASRSSRRLLVVISSSEDTTAGNAFERCSDQTVSGVVNASRSQRIPINVIKIGSPGNIQQLAAQSSGAFASVTSADVDDVLRRMLEIQSQQWLARFSVFSAAGSQTGEFQATLSSGAQTRPVDVAFQAETSVAPPASPVNVQVNGVTLDATVPQSVNVALEITNISVIDWLDVSILRDGLVQFTESGVSPQDRITLETDGLENGAYSLLVIARDSRGIELSRADEFEFEVNARQSVLLINSVAIQYGQDTLEASLGVGVLEDAVSVELLVFSEGVVLLNQSSSLASVVLLPLNAMLTADHEYSLVAIARDAMNDEITRSPAYDFSFMPPVPSAVINAVSIRYGAKLDDPTLLDVYVDLVHPDQLGGYELWIVDAAGLRVDAFTGQAPVTNPIQVSSTRLKGGEYTLFFRALDQNGGLLTLEPSTWQMQLTPLAIPFLAQVFGFARGSTFAVIAFGVLALAGIFAVREMFVRAARRVTPNLDGSSITKIGSRRLKQPKAQFVIIDKNGSELSAFEVAETPFTLGRDLPQLEHERAVSIKHATVEYAAGQGFTITDLGSTNGTKVNDKPIKPMKPTALTSGVKVTLGNTVQMLLTIYEDRP